jgi:hypothetical protein
MSSPTPGSDPNYPQGGAPQGQPGWSAPQPPAGGYNQGGGYNPAPQYSGSPAGYGAGAARPSQVTAAAIIGIVIGGLGTLFGLIGLAALGLLFAINALLGIFFLLSVAAAVVVLIGGIQAIRGQSPRLLLLGSYASIAIQLLYLIIALVSGYGFPFSSLLGFILPILIVFLLRQPQAKEYYGARGIAY